MATSSGSDLCINIHGQRATYSPGDTLQGSLTLNLLKDSAIGKVTVRFSGVTKSKIVQSNGQSTSTFRGNVVLYDIETTLHNDHYTHKKGTLDWPFEFQIPDSVDHSPSKQVWKAREGFSSTVHDAKSHPLPPSFRFAESESSKGWHVLNTYTIEATIVEPQGAQILKPTTKTATKTIRILALPTVNPIDMDDPRQRRGCVDTVTIKTLRLLPENSTAPLSLMQRTKSLFSPSSLPRFTFDIDVSYPHSLQIHHPQPLPFVVAAIPHTDAESTTIQPSMRTFYRYPPLKIRHFQLFLRATTMCRCPTVFSESFASTTHDITLVDRHFSDTLLAIRSVAWDQKNRVEDDTPTSIDLGKECSVHVTKESRDDVKGNQSKNDKGKGKKEPSKAQRLVTPSFTMYNVSRKYHLAWKVEFECVGEKVEVKGQSQEEVLVLGPAASETEGLILEDAAWMMAPEDDIDSGDEDAMVRRNLERGELPAYSELVTTETPSKAQSTAMTARKS